MCRATANGEEFENTKIRGKPIVFRYGSRPFTGGLCKGVEEALASMKTGFTHTHFNTCSSIQAAMIEDMYLFPGQRYMP